MLVGIIQSNYIPWRGYFDFINQCDLFIFHDDLQYTTSDWRNRNKIKTQNGLRWLTIPVLFKPTNPTLINSTPINYSIKWVEEHIKWFTIAYRKAPFFHEYSPALFNILKNQHISISALNIEIIKWICGILEIKTPLLLSSDLSPEGSKTDRVLDLLKKINATSYLSGPSAHDYLEINKFKNNNLALLYKTYDYIDYPQFYGEFQGFVTILDLIFMCGPDSKKYIQSASVNKVIC